MNVVNEYGEKRNGFTEVVAFCHVTCRYFDRFILQGVDRNWRQACFFYLALDLICEGYWQVNSRKSIFRIADPIYGQSYNDLIFNIKGIVIVPVMWCQEKKDGIRFTTEKCHLHGETIQSLRMYIMMRMHGT